MQQEKIIFKDLDSIAKLGADEALALLETDKGGLEADEAGRRQQAFGKNVLKEPKGKPLMLVFAAHFISPMALLLWAGGFVALIASMPTLGIAVWLVNIINGIFSFWQEYRAGKATDALKKMLPQYARVIRSGEEQKVFAEELVPGDVILLEEGDRISSDARLLECNDLQVNQSALTGESNPVRKTSEPILNDNLSSFETPNLIFAGTSVSNGTGKAVVIAIGMQTEFGKIADLTQQMEEAKSPLQKELARLTKRVTLIATGIGVIFFLGNLFYAKTLAAFAFMHALSVMVSFIPEGLLPTVTLSLAMAVQRMAKQNALVKHLSAVETLGATTVICSDKTGTLTQNEMTVSNVWMPGHEYTVTGAGYAPEGEIKLGNTAVRASDDPDLGRLLTAATLCSNARIVAPGEENPNYTVLGDPTEACLGVVAQKGGIVLKELQATAPRIRELPFDSRRKRMTTIHQVREFLPDTDRIAFIKGSPEEVMRLCSTIRLDGHTSRINDEHRSAIMKANDTYAKQGLRVLAVAYRPLTKDCGLPRELSSYTIELIEKDLSFAGLIAMSDPPRPEVTAAVEQCHEASVRIIMITGDYGLTAQSIAKRIGIVEGEHPRMITGVEMDDLSDSELKEALAGEIIFARMAPEQKYRVVCCLQESGNIVAVTGDGVNDSPALKKADIGIAMGIAGTDVAKEAADMILTDDNFASIVKAIREGRTVYNNIRKFLTYILTSNMSTAVPDFSFLLSRGGIPLPLPIMQNLAVDLGTDIVPALGLGVEPPRSEVMEKPPRAADERLLNRKLICKAFLWYGLLAGALAMGAYFYANMLNGWPRVPLAGVGTAVYATATTMTFGAIVFAQVGNVLNCRTEKESVFKIGIFSNKRVMSGIVIEVALLACLAYVPFLQRVFETGPIGLREWIILALVPVPVVLFEEIRKWIIRKRNK